MNPTYANLGILVGAYFHQDWMCDSADPADIVESFRRDNPVDMVEATIREIQEILMSRPPQPELEALLASLGCYLSFKQIGVPAIAWLTQVIELLRNGRTR